MVRCCSEEEAVLRILAAVERRSRGCSGRVCARIVRCWRSRREERLINGFLSG